VILVEFTISNSTNLSQYSVILNSIKMELIANLMLLSDKPKTIFAPFS